MIRRTLRLLTVAVLALPLAARADLDPAQVLKELELRESAVPVREMKGWSKPKKVVVVAPTPRILESYQEVAPGVEVVGAPTPDDIPKYAKDADAIIGNCTPDIVNASRKLKWLQIQSAGVNECLTIPRLMKGDVLVTNSQRVFGPAIAEHAIGMLFYLTRNFRDFTLMTQDAKWDRFRVPQRKFIELQGKTMLVVGLGGIGSSIAMRAHALGMNVIATRASSREKPDYVEYVGLADELLALVPRADVVANAAPLTPQTEGMFNAELFAAMKPGAYFINIARGSQVVQSDLIAALQSGRIAGAALDVVDPEPMPPEHPLWKAPNVLITPHISGSSDLRNERGLIVMRENLRRYVAGEKVFSVVDLKRGY